MMRRATWFVAGAATGAAGAVAAARKVRRTAERLAPANVARTAVAGIKDRVHEVADAVREGKAAMVAKELELRARRDGHPVSYGRHDDGPMIDADATVHHGVHDLAAWRQRSPRRARRG